MYDVASLVIDPRPSDEAWCHWCGSSIGLDLSWRALKDRRMAAKTDQPDPHSRYCTGIDPRSC